MKPYVWVTREEMLKSGFTLDGEEDAPNYEKDPTPKPDKKTTPPPLPTVRR